MIKSQLRKQFIDRRNQLSQVEYDALNQQLLQQFMQLDLTGVKCIHLFLPIHKRKEPDTFLLRDWLRSHHPRVQRVFPKADFASHTMQNFADDDELELVINALGIPEPVNGTPVSAAEIDMMLVPLLAFDFRGYRVGYGKGFYDRFITQCRKDVKLVGLSFFEPIVQITDIDVFDKPIHQCLLPSGVIELPIKGPHELL